MVERLLAEGKTVTAYDNLSSGRREWIEHNIGRPGFTFIQADLLEPRRLREAMAGHDLVIHLGANTDIPGGNQNVRLDLENCTIATHNVLEAMRVTGIRRLLFSSSSAVCGKAPIPAGRRGPCCPSRLYGAAKLGCETIVSAYCTSSRYSLDVPFANVVGGGWPRRDHDFIQKLKRNPEELESGRGEQENPSSGGDCIDGIFCAFERSDSWCDVFNLGCASSSKISRVAEIVAQEMGLGGARLRYTGGRRGWVGDVPRVGLDVSKMRNLGWQARHTSDEAVRVADACWG
jgi:UDP-glucose 4-epimerase